MHDVALSAANLAVARGRRTILRDVTFDVAAGQVLSVLGPNGAGKSTLLRALAGLLPYERGEIRLSGQPISQLSAAERARRLALVPQQSGLTVALSVAAVVAQGRYPHRTGLGGLRAADRAAIEAAMVATGVEALAGRPFTQLSEGERKRVLIARALATDAPLLLLDEPTAALDIRHSLELHRLLRRLASDGRAIVVVLHPLDEARRFTDHCLALSEGTIAAWGPTAVVLSPELVRRVYGVELVEGGAPSFRLPQAP